VGRGGLCQSVGTARDPTRVRFVAESLLVLLYRPGGLSGVLLGVRAPGIHATTQGLAERDTAAP
jgi:hypothetical protein